MGDRKQTEAAQLPPALVAAARKMKPGDVSDLIQLGPNYTLFRLNGYRAAGQVPFAEVKGKLQSELQKAKYDSLRAELAKQRVLIEAQQQQIADMERQRQFQRATTIS